MIIAFGHVRFLVHHRFVDVRQLATIDGLRATRLGHATTAALMTPHEALEVSTGLQVARENGIRLETDLHLVRTHVYEATSAGKCPASPEHIAIWLGGPT